MKVKDYLKNYRADRFFILDSHQEAMIEQDVGHQHADNDYIGYAYNIHQYNQLTVNSMFLYRRPGKLSDDKKFHIYGGGVVESITPQDDNGNVIANISHAFKLDSPINQGDEFIESFVWERKKKPGPGWKGFWMNYGMNQITEKDFWSLVNELDCTVIRDNSTDYNEEDILLNTNDIIGFSIAHNDPDVSDRRIASYANRTFSSKFVTKVDFSLINNRNKKLGSAGELLVLEYENQKLKKLNLPYSAEHVSETIGDGLGYDIISYDNSGNEIHIEVKTTRTANKDCFYMSRREITEANNSDYTYKIYRLYNFNEEKGTADMLIIDADQIKQLFEMTPVSYIVKEKK